MRNPIKTVRKSGRTNLFFMEMMIVLLFFSIASAVILRSFAASGKLAERSRQMEDMSFFAQSAAEIYSGDPDIADTAAELVSGGSCSYTVSDDPSVTALLMDNDITVLMTEAPEEYGGGFVKTLKMTFTDDQGGILYEFETGTYVPGKKVTDGGA